MAPLMAPMLPPALAAAPPGTAPAGTDPVQQARLQEAAERFEGLFIHQMLKTMRQSAGPLAGEDTPLRLDPDDPLLGLADQLVADSLASQRAFGIADMLMRQLLPTQPPSPLQPPAPLKASPASVALPVQMDTAAPPQSPPTEHAR